MRFTLHQMSRIPAQLPLLTAGTMMLSRYQWPSTKKTPGLPLRKQLLTWCSVSCNSNPLHPLLMYQHNMSHSTFPLLDLNGLIAFWGPLHYLSCRESVVCGGWGLWYVESTICTQAAHQLHIQEKLISQWLVLFFNCFKSRTKYLIC